LTTLRIKSIRKLDSPRRVYDLSVVQNHNFFVGKSKVLTSNCDYLSTSGQAMLRSVLETYASHARFILTCNFIHKVIPAIASRCQKFEISPNSKRDEMVRLAEILTAEKVTFKPEDVAFIVSQYHPDMRSIIQYAQQCSTSGELKIVRENLVEANVKQRLVDILKSPTKTAFNDIRQMLADAGIASYEDLYSHLYDNTSVYAKGNEPVAVIHIAESMYQASMVIPKAQEIMFMALVNKLLTDLR
jgi:DNA polymerase III delta prime subunit